MDYFAFLKISVMQAGVTSTVAADCFAQMWPKFLCPEALAGFNAWTWRQNEIMMVFVVLWGIFTSLKSHQKTQA